MRRPEFAPEQRRTELRLIHVLWLTSGLSCDGDTVSMTAATSPSLEDLLTGVIPGHAAHRHSTTRCSPTRRRGLRARVRRRRERRLDPFLLVLEGSVPTRRSTARAYWAGFGVDPETGQPIPTTDWIDRLAPRADAVLALGTCAAYGGIPAMKNNPTGAMGLATTSAGMAVAPRPPAREPARLPGAARQHHRDAARAGAATSAASARARPRRAGPAPGAVRPHGARALRPCRPGRAGPLLRPRTATASAS